jgi:molybdate transport system permease protein
VLPPSVLGFYLLVVFSPSSPVGAALLNMFGLRLVFSFEGLVVASVLFNLPFMLNPILAGFESLPNGLLEASYVLGKSRMTTLLRVILPNVRPSLLAGLVLTFAHTIGEFGVVLMIGGKIPGVTRVASLAVYDEVEALNYGAANFYAMVLLAVSFVVLALLFAFNKRAVRTV